MQSAIVNKELIISIVFFPAKKSWQISNDAQM